MCARFVPARSVSALLCEAVGLCEAPTGRQGIDLRGPGHSPRVVWPGGQIGSSVSLDARCGLHLRQQKPSRMGIELLDIDLTRKYLIDVYIIRSRVLTYPAQLITKIANIIGSISNWRRSECLFYLCITFSAQSGWHQLMYLIPSVFLKTKFATGFPVTINSKKLLGRRVNKIK